MKKIALFFLFLFTIGTGFAEELILDNQTSYPNKDPKAKIAVQWACTPKEVDEANKALMYGSPLDQKTLQILTQSGKIILHLPDKAEYFRVLVWSKDIPEPDLATNWIDIEPNKTYTLDQNHLVPTVLMLGTGC